MRFDTKIAIVVRDDLAAWQRLNVTAFLSSAVAAGEPALIGEPYEDASGNRYLPMFGQPVLVYVASAEQLAAAHARALTRDDIREAVYIEDMFKTGNDADNRATVADRASDDLPLVGIALHGPRNPIDKILKGLPLHP
ncbi:DUF2000 domain-containing protein [Actinomadura rupiterrae]|uniref:DUF2000 domain-containing protein n=1 Tax=Actinomadura rupiterrae TaxID=559627 RepID=UPI0020A51DB9|nr:DUF2000 domain-containing protein [Actinomadura rupiterrae]MCP2336426.1 hypothetical protein [Actinomadura rupiterrae]